MNRIVGSALGEPGPRPSTVQMESASIKGKRRKAREQVDDQDAARWRQSVAGLLCGFQREGHGNILLRMAFWTAVIGCLLLTGTIQVNLGGGIRTGSGTEGLLDFDTEAKVGPVRGLESDENDPRDEDRIGGLEQVRKSRRLGEQRVGQGEVGGHGGERQGARVIGEEEEEEEGEGGGGGGKGLGEEAMEDGEEGEGEGLKSAGEYNPGVTSGDGVQDREEEDGEGENGVSRETKVGKNVVQNRFGTGETTAKKFSERGEEDEGASLGTNQGRRTRQVAHANLGTPLGHLLRLAGSELNQAGSGKARRGGQEEQWVDAESKRGEGLRGRGQGTGGESGKSLSGDLSRRPRSEQQGEVVLATAERERKDDKGADQSETATSEEGKDKGRGPEEEGYTGEGLSGSSDQRGQTKEQTNGEETTGAEPVRRDEEAEIVEALLNGTRPSKAYAARIPGTPIRTAKGVRAVEAKLRCLAQEGRWAYNGTPRWIPWDLNPLTDPEQPNYKSCDIIYARQHKGVYGAAAERARSSQRRTGWKVRPALRFQWKTTEGRGCAFRPFDRLDFCRAVGGRNVVMVGDSMQLQLHDSMLNHLVTEKTKREEAGDLGDARTPCKGHRLCGDTPYGFTMHTIRNDLLTPDMRSGKHGFAPWLRRLPKLRPGILILNRGAHYAKSSILLKNLDAILRRLRRAHPRLLIIWRNTPAGHPGCFWKKRGARPLEKRIAVKPTRSRNRWHKFEAQNKLTQRIMKDFGVVYMDVEFATALRPDGHFQRLDGFSDCLHYCSPGPVDHWMSLLYNVLRELGRTSKKGVS